MQKHKHLTSTAVLALALAFGAQAQAKELTVADYGGAQNEAYKQAFYKPFSETTGMAVKEDTWSGELAKLRAMVEGGSVIWDVVNTEPQTADQACSQDLLEKLDYKKLYDPSQLAEGAATECAVGLSTFATILAYDKAKFAKAPTSTSDIFDLKTFPGKRALRKSPSDNLELALVADGVPPAKVYEVLATPQGVDRAFKKLDTIKGQVVWWEAGAQPAQMLKSGEVAMALAWNGRIYNANTKEKADLGIAWGNQLQGYEVWVIPKGAKNIDAAYQFIKFTLSPEGNPRLASYIPYGPTSKAAAAKVSPDILPNLPTYPQNSEGAVVQNGSFWADHGEELNARFSAWLSK